MAWGFDARTRRPYICDLDDRLQSMHALQFRLSGSAEQAWGSLSFFDKAGEPHNAQYMQAFINAQAITIPPPREASVLGYKLPELYITRGGLRRRFRLALIRYI